MTQLTSRPNLSAHFRLGKPLRSQLPDIHRYSINRVNKVVGLRERFPEETTPEHPLAQT